MIAISPTKLQGVVSITPSAMHEDFRGTNTEIFNEKIYEESVANVKWKMDSVSTSSRHVLRGIHGDDSTWKLITCLHGSIYLVVVDARPTSSKFRQWVSFTLSDKNRKQVLVPPGFGNAHLVMSDHAVFYYKWSEYYDRLNQFTIKWNDPEYNIWWPVSNPILSERDSFLNS
jgi:dTDP-4-dehydrorhamnose 3,5-epimerase